MLFSILAMLPNLPPDLPPAMPPPAVAQPADRAEVTVLTYNVRGLPWPLAFGRKKALRAIGEELAALRLAGRQPTVVFIQEGFREEVADLVRASGYAYWAQGPSRGDRPSAEPPAAGRDYPRVRYLAAGEGWGKLTGAGLYVLSDLPITEVRRAAYRYCAGLDCLANKGVMLARVQVPGAPQEIALVNTHMNAKRAARVPRDRSSRAHNLQTDELLRFVGQHAADAPLLLGGDFNVKNAPERYNHRADERPYKVVSEYCLKADLPCEGAERQGQPWLKSQDLQAFASGGAITVAPGRIETVFSAKGRRYSDHDGYLVSYRLSWEGAAPAPHPFEAPRALAQVAP